MVFGTLSPIISVPGPLRFFALRAHGLVALLLMRVITIFEPRKNPKATALSRSHGLPRVGLGALEIICYGFMKTMRII